MRDYIRTIPETYVTEKSERIRELTVRLEVSADRVCDFQERLMDGTDKLRPAEYDSLLDEYRAELVRYDRLDRELKTLEAPKKTPMDKEKRCKLNRERREKINY